MGVDAPPCGVDSTSDGGADMLAACLALEQPAVPRTRLTTTNRVHDLASRIRVSILSQPTDGRARRTV